MGPHAPEGERDEQSQIFYDELTGEALPTGLVRAARREKVDFMGRWGCC